MALPTPLKFMGAPGSPYTRKMLSLLRFRHIPYQLLIGDQSTLQDLPKPKVSLLPTFYLPNDKGEIEAVVDSTPLIRRFETEFSERSVIPKDPVMSFLNYLLEDYGDEWLTKAMFHYRWYYDADIEKAGRILPTWRNISAPEENLIAMSKVISQRQIERLYVVGSNDITAPVIEASYHRFLAIFDKVLQQQPFLMGQRPGSADFAFYAQLTQLAKFDPTPAQICLEESPRIYAWTDVVDDLSGNTASEDGWLAREQAKNVLGDLLSEVGRVYVPAMIANAEALMAGSNQMETTIDGKPWSQPAFPYQGKCLQWVRQEYGALGDEERNVVDEILSGTGCEALFHG